MREPAKSEPPRTERGRLARGPEGTLPSPGRGRDAHATNLRVDKRQLTFYSRMMIESFKHKGLRNLFEHDDALKIKADQVDRLRLILSALDQ
jgi:hypothetical protein